MLIKIDQCKLWKSLRFVTFINACLAQVHNCFLVDLIYHIETIIATLANATMVNGMLNTLSSQIEFKMKRKSRWKEIERLDLNRIVSK